MPRPCAAAMAEPESLFSLELLVDWVRLELPPPRVPPRPALGFRLLDFPTLLIYPPGEEDSPRPGEEERSPGEEDSLRPGEEGSPRPGEEEHSPPPLLVPFGRGKSCLFRLGLGTLQARLGRCPLYALLLDLRGAPALPRLLGSCPLSLAAAARGLLQGPRGACAHRGQHPLHDLMGRPVGQLSLRYRLRSLGGGLPGPLPNTREWGTVEPGQDRGTQGMGLGGGTQGPEQGGGTVERGLDGGTQGRSGDTQGRSTQGQGGGTEGQDGVTKGPGQGGGTQGQSGDNQGQGGGTEELGLGGDTQGQGMATQGPEQGASPQQGIGELEGPWAGRTAATQTSQRSSSGSWSRAAAEERLEAESNVCCPPPMYYSRGPTEPPVAPRCTLPCPGRVEQEPRAAQIREPSLEAAALPGPSGSTLGQLPLLSALLLELSLLLPGPQHSPPLLHPQLAWLYQPPEQAAPTPVDRGSPSPKVHKRHRPDVPATTRAAPSSPTRTRRVAPSSPTGAGRAPPREAAQGGSSAGSGPPPRRLLYGLTHTLRLRLQHHNPALLPLAERREQLRRRWAAEESRSRGILASTPRSPRRRHARRSPRNTPIDENIETLIQSSRAKDSGSAAGQQPDPARLLRRREENTDPHRVYPGPEEKPVPAPRAWMPEPRSEAPQISERGSAQMNYSGSSEDFSSPEPRSSDSGPSVHTAPTPRISHVSPVQSCTRAPHVPGPPALLTALTLSDWSAETPSGAPRGTPTPGAEDMDTGHRSVETSQSSTDTCDVELSATLDPLWKDPCSGAPGTLGVSGQYRLMTDLLVRPFPGYTL